MSTKIKWPNLTKRNKLRKRDNADFCQMIDGIVHKATNSLNPITVGGIKGDRRSRSVKSSRYIPKKGFKLGINCKSIYQSDEAPWETVPFIEYTPELGFFVHVDRDMHTKC